MDLWQQLEEAIRERGVRVEERMTLLAEVRADGELTGLQRRLEAAAEQLEDAAARLRREARGR